MKIHEYQGKEILRQFGVPVPRGYPAFSIREASEAAQKKLFEYLVGQEKAHKMRLEQEYEKYVLTED